MTELADAYCFPVCTPCGEAGVCSRAGELVAYEAKKAKRLARHRWQPNDEPVVDLTCGCRGLRWPVIKVFGSSIKMIICETHGEVRVKPKRKLKPKDDTEEIPF